MRPPKSPELASESTQVWWRCPGLVYFLAVGTPVIAVKIGMLAITPKTNLKSALIRRLSPDSLGMPDKIGMLVAEVPIDGT